MFGFRVIAEEGWKDDPVIDGAIGSRGSASRGYLLAGHNCHLELFEYTSPRANCGIPPVSMDPMSAVYGTWRSTWTTARRNSGVYWNSGAAHWVDRQPWQLDKKPPIAAIPSAISSN